jgi:hypothetical protein
MTSTSLAADAAASSAEDWTREATRLHGRYLIEVVERHGLCPWAVKARVSNRLRVAVVLQADALSVEPSLAALEPWVLDERVEVAFLLYPRLPLGRADFDAFAARVRDTDATRRPLGEAPFAMVAFHPDADPQMSDAERLIPFLRRTPDPCIQVVRVDVLNRVRSGVPEGTQFFDASLLETMPAARTEPTLRERVARANLETTRAVGVDVLKTRMDAIRLDRDETYRALERR